MKGTRRRAASVLLFGLFLADAASAAVPDQFFSATDDWRMERFGDDVAILRVPFTSDQRMGGAGSLTLSCEGPAAQIRIDFGTGVIVSGNQADGKALLRAYGSRRTLAAAFGFAWNVGRILTLSGDPLRRSASVQAVVAMLRLRPASLDGLLMWTDRGREAARWFPVHFTLGQHQVDPTLLDTFAGACGLGASEDGAKSKNRSR